jgi:hypothetical protein
MRSLIKNTEKKCDVDSVECIVLWDEVDDYAKELDEIMAKEQDKMCHALTAIDEFCEDNWDVTECTSDDTY